MPTKKASTKTKTNTKKPGQKQAESQGQGQKDKFSEFKVYGHDLVAEVKKIVKAGNVRRIIIKNEKGKVLMEFPVTIAVIGTVFAPVLAAVGALAALVGKCSIVVEKK
jgi:hypothetical protein